MPDLIFFETVQAFVFYFLFASFSLPKVSYLNTFLFFAKITQPDNL